MEGFLLEVFIFLISAAIAVTLARKLGVGSVLGYLIAGIVIGPFGMSLVSDAEAVLHFTEFGVVMLLFLVGLELKPSLLMRLLVPILGMGGAQVVISTAVITAIGAYFLDWQPALAIGLILSLSSTAIVLQTLQERGQMSTTGGQAIFSVLLFQDLAFIPILAVLPFLATAEIFFAGEYAGGRFVINALPSYIQALVIILALLLVILAGKFACGPGI